MMTQVNFTLNLDKFKEDVMPSSLNDVLKSTIVEAYGMMDGKKRYISIKKTGLNSVLGFLISMTLSKFYPRKKYRSLKLRSLNYLVHTAQDERMIFKLNLSMRRCYVYLFTAMLPLTCKR